MQLNATQPNSMQLNASQCNFRNRQHNLKMQSMNFFELNFIPKENAADLRHLERRRLPTIRNRELVRELQRKVSNQQRLQVSTKSTAVAVSVQSQLEMNKLQKC